LPGVMVYKQVSEIMGLGSTNGAWASSHPTRGARAGPAAGAKVLVSAVVGTPTWTPNFTLGARVGRRLVGARAALRLPCARAGEASVCACLCGWDGWEGGKIEKKRSPHRLGYSRDGKPYTGGGGGGLPPAAARSGAASCVQAADSA